MTLVPGAAQRVSGALQTRDRQIVRGTHFQCSRGTFRNLARSEEFTATSKVTPSR